MRILTIRRPCRNLRVFVKKTKLSFATNIFCFIYYNFKYINVHWWLAFKLAGLWLDNEHCVVKSSDKNQKYPIIKLQRDFRQLGEWVKK